MDLKERFREELIYLRELGREFAEDNPQLARFLGEQANDPDVERLLEGFAFLTARLRMKIDDDLPELTHSLLQMLWPNYLRPLPSTTIVRFTPLLETISQQQVLPKGTRLFTQPLKGVSCEFRTCTEINLYPLAVLEVSDAHSREASTLRVDLAVLTKQPLDQLGCDRLEFYLGGDEATAQTLYLWIARYLKKLTLHVADQQYEMNPQDVGFPGFTAEEALLPYPRNAFDGYRILQEYFVFPQRFHFFSLERLSRIWPDLCTTQFRIEFQFSRPMPPNTRLRTSDLHLFCTPAVNLFQHHAEPITLDGKSLEYRVRPSGGRAEAYEIFSIDQVLGNPPCERQGSDDSVRVYRPFESFQHEVEQAQGRPALYFRSHIEASHGRAGLQHRIAFMRDDERLHVGKMETASIDLTCSNGDLPQLLGVGDLSLSNEDTPSFATYTNLTAPTRTYRPILDSSLHWTLISNLSLNYLSLLSAEPLKAVIRAYDFAALHDLQQARATRKRLDGIGEATTIPVDWLMKGLPVRGMHTRLKLDQQAFLCEGELYLFASVLSRFFALYASINSFHRLEVINTTNNEHYEWPLLSGRQPVI
ncbi:type VI secretion system baseplate subunit TssF [Pseudomonas vanderleydeniana]|uniref:Type VI secretion system baseplate subunit TssF n=1 Tax=Pseudomonas vanderleydeniana TaxID=2745495 RepID=A0A9E6TU80_9PSED|nr:type VI secretion system baseplate subunit TssF [Pseudomonas vanderleydeniana]QXI30584.1 type VI secretion system baseplate subunit TssF [Pseudomonas vanderleydeniana]